MWHSSGLAVLAGAFTLYALLARLLERWSITAPMAFIFVGVLIGPSGFDLVHFSLGAPPVTLIAELTLAVILFADASTVVLRDVEADASIPGRLLFIGLPLTMLVGTLVARALFPSDGWAASALIAAILAPTDAALGLAIFTDRSVPARIRRALNIESGLNDGIATPFVTLFLALVVAEQGEGPTDWLAASVVDLLIAGVVALAVGLGGGWLMRWVTRRRWTTATSSDLGVLSLALFSYALALALGGNGFVAAFAGGIFFGRMNSGAHEEAIEFTERIGLFASFLVWTIFGALFAAPLLTEPFDLAPLVYAVFSLTVVRMVPVALALVGSGFGRVTVAFIGWFGPRGLASVVFTLIAWEALHERGSDAHHLVEVATWTILLSVYTHGLSARPLAAFYGRWIRGRGVAPELVAHPEPKVRRRL
jgi:NhaP-type Na+/H+ or K+/H+ antiporter